MWPFSRHWTFEDFDVMFKEMEDLMTKELNQLSKRAPGELLRERTLPSGGKVKEWGPFVYGYSMIVGPHGKPKIREFGNIKLRKRLGKPRLDIREKREPLADIILNENNVSLVMELPGVEKKDINLSGTEDTLTVSVDTPKRKYYKELELPDKVDPKTAKSKYKNGVLEVIIQKKKEKEPKGEPIKID
jgi:HSP20 family protein